MQRDDRGLKFGWLWVLAYSIFAHLGSPTQAQVVPDATLGAGKNSITNTQGNRTDITGGLRRNSALFHSFDRFSIDTNRQVYFANPTGIRNIFSRVTGGSVSNIDGVLGVSGSANLFFMNPNGIIFGPSARLDVSGSFLATTANALEFPDGQRFAATGDRAVPLVEVNIPIGLQIAANAPAMLNNQGNLAVGAGQNLTLTGGTTTHTGTLTASGGTVQVLGNQVNLVDQARVDVSSPTGGGTVLVGGDYQGRGSLLNSTQTTVGSGVSITANATAQGNGGKVIVWSDGHTQFGGNISAQGGPQGGNGGFVETSGRQTLAVLPSATVSTRAPQGSLGTWLLDPTDLTVQASGTATLAGGPPLTNTPAATTTINAATIVAGLNGNNVDLQATNSITVNEAIDASGNTNPGNLSLSTTGPAGTTNLNQPITLRAGNTLSGTATTVNVAATGRIQNGVDVANPTGATVTVATGTYGENVTVNKNLNLAFGVPGVTATSLTTNPANTVGLTGSLTTGDNQTYNGPVALNGSTVLKGENLGLSSAPFTGNGNDLSLEFVNSIAVSNSQFSGLRNFTNNGAGGTVITGDFTTTGTQAYGNAVTLASVGSTINLNGTSIAFNSTLDGLRTLIATATSGNLTFGNVGGNVAVGDLVTRSSGTTTLGPVRSASINTRTGGDVQLNGNITTDGSQIYENPVSLNGATIALTGTSIAFNNTLNGNSNLTATATVASLTFTTVGDNIPLGALTANAAGGIQLNGTIDTTIQTYNDAVSLTGDTVLKGTVLVLNVFPLTGNNRDLDLNFANPIAVSNSQFSGLRNFANNGPGGTQIVGDLTTTGTQTYGNAVTLGANATLTGTTVEFGSTVNGTQALAVNGNATFRDAVGSVAPLQSLVVEQSSNLNGGSIRTLGDQIYKGAVTLGATTNLSGANLRFDNTIGGNQALTATGNVTLTGSNPDLAFTTLTLNPNSPLTITANNSSTRLTIDTLVLNNNTIATTGTGTHTLTLQPNTRSQITLNNPTPPATALNFSEAQLNSLVNFGQVTIGRAGSTIPITVSSALTLTQPYNLTFQGGNLTFAGGLTLAENTKLDIQSNGVTDNIASNAPAISFTNGSGTIAFNLTGNVGAPASDPTAAPGSPASLGPLKIEGTIGTSTVNGNLHLQSSQQITQSGAIVVSRNASFRSTQPNAGNATLRSDTDTATLTGISRIGGNLGITLNSTATISQAPGSTLQVVGRLNLLPFKLYGDIPDNNNILAPKPVVTGNDVFVNGRGGVNLTTALADPDVPTTINNLTVRVTAQDQIFFFTESPRDGRDGIVLTQTGNQFNGRLTLNTDSPAPVAASPVDAIIFQTGSSGIRAAGIVNLKVENSTNTGVISLPSSTNSFGPLELLGGTVTIGQAGNMNVTSATIARDLNLTSGGNLSLNNATVGGSLISSSGGTTTLNNLTISGPQVTVTAGSGINQTGAVTQSLTTATTRFITKDANSTIALNNPNNQIRGKIGFTTPNGADASLTNSGTIQVGTSDLGSGSNLTLTNVSNAIDFTNAALTTAPDATIRIQSIDPTRNIALNTVVPGQLSVDVTQLSAAITNRSTEIIIGQDTATGNVTGTTPISITNPLTVHGGAITLNGSIGTSGGSLSLLANTGDVRTQGINTSSDQRNGGNVVLQGQNIFVVGDINPVAFGIHKTGDVRITATNGDVNLTNGTAFFDVFGSRGDGIIEAPGRNLILDNYKIVGTVNPSASTPGGTTTLTANTITLKNSSQLQVATTGQQTGGTLALNAIDRLLLNQATIVNNTSGPGNGGNISLQGGNSVRLENNTQINTTTSGKGDGGAVLVRGNTATLTDNAQITATNSGSGRGSAVLVQGNDRLDANSAQITTTTSGSGTGSSVDLRGDTVTLTGATTTLKTAVTPGATGSGGNVTVQGNTITLAQGAKAETITESTANTSTGGTIAFNAAGDLVLQGAIITNTATGSAKGGTIALVGNALTVTNQTQIAANTAGTATGGTIFLAANALTIHDQTQITALTSGGGSGGGIRLEGNKVASISGDGTVLRTDASGSGVGSSVTVAGQKIELTDRVRVESNVSSSGNGGAVQLGNASTDSLTLEDSTIATTVAAGATGQGSSVGLQGNRILLDQAQVEANVLLGSGGRGSDISLVGGNIRLQGKSQVSTQTAADNTRAGNITIAAQTSFNLVEQSQLLTTASALGATGGNITFKGSQFNIDTAQVSASSALGPAGNIDFTAQNLTLRQGRLTAENGQTSRNPAGNITLRVFGRMTLSDESLISTSGQNGANSGNIFITSVSFAFAEAPTGLNGSDIIARSTGGRGGNVVFTPKLVQGFKVQPALPGNRTNDIDSNGEVEASGSSLSAVQVQIKPLEPQATSTTPQGCSVGGNSVQKESRFTVGGRGGVQLSPTALLPAQAASSDWVSLETAPIATAPPFPDGNLAVLQPGQTYQIQTVCVNSWKTQQRSSL
jgi:filamentous hemagglutinin family protein